MSNTPYRPSVDSTVIERYIPLVRRLAYHLQARLPPSVDVDDLIQSGFMGLLDALAKISDPEGEERFEHYASVRIRGAMLDTLRGFDPLPRRARAKLRRAQKALSELEQALGRPPSERDVAERLGCSLEEYHVVLRDAAAAQILYLEDLRGDGEPPGGEGRRGDSQPLQWLEREQFVEALTDAVEALPEREQMAVTLYYHEELNLKEIGVVLGVSESRVSQILRQASLRLRNGLTAWRRIPGSPENGSSAVNKV